MCILDMDKKRELWGEMRSIVGCITEEPMCFIGDFNCIRSELERMKCVYARVDVEEFNTMIEDLNLLEISMVNASFTWFGYEGKMSRLDRALVDLVWFEVDRWKVQALSKKHSDHKALLLYCEEVKKESHPFKIFNCFLNNELLEEIRQSLISKSD